MSRPRTPFGAAVLFAAAGSLLPSTLLAQANYSESFDAVSSTQSNSTGPTTLTSRGWIFRNQSNPQGSYAWYLIYPGLNSAYPSANAGPNYLAINSGASGGFFTPINAWAIVPPAGGQRAGDTLTFWVNPSLGNAQLEIRYSPNGGTSTGSSATSVGDFTQLLGTVTGGTSSWMQVQYTLPGNGRVAFRFTGTTYSIGGGSDLVGIDSLTIGAPPTPPCNLPPTPAAGQTVHWTAAAPYRVCQSITIPAGGTVIVDPGAVINVDANRTVTVNGAIRMQGTQAQPVTMAHAANFPPMLEVNGELTTAFTTIRGQVRPNANSTLDMADTTFTGPNGAIFSDLYTGTAFGRFNRVTFNSSEFTISNTTLVIDGLTLTNSVGRLARDYTFLANVVVDGKPLDVDAAPQGTAVDTVTVRNVIGPPGGQTVSTGYGLGLNYGNFAIGPTASFTNNSFPVRIVSAGILPGSAAAMSGNLDNAIYVPGRDHSGNSIWSDIGIPYYIPSFYSQHGGELRIEEGVTVKIASGAGMAGDPSKVTIYGTPQRPVTVRQAVAGQPWYPLQNFHRIRHATLDGATRAAAWPSQLGWGFLDSSVVRNCTEFGVTGQAIVRKTLFENNAVGAQVSWPNDLLGDTNPNAFENNGVGVGGAQNARFDWWNSPTGPTSPDNPGGTGDPKANGVPFLPFRTERPDFTDNPPVVTLERQSFIARPGQKVIINWKASDDRSIVSQKVYMVADGSVVQGNLSEPIIVLGDNLHGALRSFEFVMPEPATRTFGSGNLRVESIDDAGQIGWDDLEIYSERDEPGQLVLTSPLATSATAGANMGSVCWQAQGIANTGGSINARILLENTGEWISLGGVTTYLNCLSGQLTAPFASTDRARIVLDLFTGGGRNQPEYYYGPVFSIRPDARTGDAAPTVSLTSPAAGLSIAGGQTVHLAWTAGDDRPLRSFHIQQSTDAGRTWSFIARDLPGTATSYDWTLPSSNGAAGVRLKVVAVDHNFQDTSSITTINITPGQFTPPATCAADLGSQGGLPGHDGVLDNNDFIVFINLFFNGNAAADLGQQGGIAGHDGAFDNNDFIAFINMFFAGC